MKIAKREMDVLELLCSGYEDREIALELNLSKCTISTYITRLLMKLNAKNRTHAAVLYYAWKMDSKEI